MTNWGELIPPCSCVALIGIQRGLSQWSKRVHRRVKFITYRKALKTRSESLYNMTCSPRRSAIPLDIDKRREILFFFRFIDHLVIFTVARTETKSEISRVSYFNEEKKNPGIEIQMWKLIESLLTHSPLVYWFCFADRPEQKIVNIRVALHSARASASFRRIFNFRVFIRRRTCVNYPRESFNRESEIIYIVLCKCNDS